MDRRANAYVTGLTNTPGSGFPGTAGSPIQSTFGGGQDAFVTKLNAAGTALVYSTYLGGSGDESASGSPWTSGQRLRDRETAPLGSGFPGTAGSLIQSTFGGGCRRLCGEDQHAILHRPAAPRRPCPLSCGRPIISLSR